MSASKCNMMDRIRANPEGAPAGAAYSGLDVGDAPPNPRFSADITSGDIRVRDGS